MPIRKRHFFAGVLMWLAIVGATPLLAQVSVVGSQSVEGIKFEPLPAVFVVASRGTVEESSIEIINSRPEALEIRGIESKSTRFAARIESLESGKRYRLTVTLKGEGAAGKQQDILELRTNLEDAPVLRVYVNTFVRERVYTFPTSLFLGRYPVSEIQGKPAVAKQRAQILMVYQEGSSQFQAQVTSDLPFLKISSERGPLGDRYENAIWIDPELARPGEIKGNIIIETNDPENPKLTVPVWGDLQPAREDVRGEALSPEVDVVPPVSAPPRQPLAVVAGKAIYEEDLLPLIEGPMQNLRRQEHELKSKALETLVQQRLLAVEAAKQGISPEQLLEREADAKVSAPTDAEIEALYQAQKIKRPLEEVKSRIGEVLRQQKVKQAHQAYLASLRAGADVAIHLEAPRIEVSYDLARVRGDKNAPVTIVEFSDFQCPFCRKVHPVLKELLSRYEGKVKLAYRDFPLRALHPDAVRAAEASRCAAEQGSYWQYHDRLFESQNKLDGASLGKYAEELGLDRKQFDDCLTTGKFRPQIERDYQDGIRLGVTGTPAFFVNGTVLTGALPLASFEKVIEEELAAIEKARAEGKSEFRTR
ncbi:MAG: thioredoxin domain-containing protein [Candidatus Acidiferrales bacterium]